jgi:hypothetical protein
MRFDPQRSGVCGPRRTTGGLQARRVHPLDDVLRVKVAQDLVAEIAGKLARGGIASTKILRCRHDVSGCACCVGIEGLPEAPPTSPNRDFSNPGAVLRTCTSLGRALAARLLVEATCSSGRAIRHARARDFQSVHPHSPRRCCAPRCTVKPP